MLVQRGWVAARLDDRTRAAAVADARRATVAVDGRIAPPPARLFEFDGAASGPIRQNLDLDAFARETGLRLLPLSVLQTMRRRSRRRPARATGRAPAADVHKHHGYAFQWFALRALIAGLYVWFQLIRPRRRAAPERRC